MISDYREMVDALHKAMETPSLIDRDGVMRFSVEVIEMITETIEQLGKERDELVKKRNGLNDRWISVEDRLPGEPGQYLVIYHFAEARMKFYGTLYYHLVDGPHWQHESAGLRVDYWMKIPKHPEEERCV